MAQIHRTQRRIEFRDTDAAGIVHFSRFFTLMEETEHEFLRVLGTSVVAENADGDVISWPRVRAECDYSGALRFEEVVDIEVWVEKVGKSSVRYGFRFLLGGQVVATGALTTVCCRIHSGQRPQSMPIPDDLRARLEEFLQEDTPST